MDSENKAQFRISDLREHQAWIPSIALLHHKEWLRSHRALDVVGEARDILDSKLQEREQALLKHIECDALPTTLVAHIESEPIGTVSLVYYQLTDQEKATEWLTNMFVLRPCRRRGVASALMDAALEYARHQGVRRLLLYTADQAHFYRKRHWRSINSGFIQGQRVEIMDYALEEQTPK